MAESRVQKTLMNAKVNMIFYFLNLAMSFFSRKIFLDALGADFFGLTSTLQSFLGFLSLVELGIGQSIGYALYKPLFEKDYKKINEIVSVLGYLYYIVGFVILGCGIVISLFFPVIFEKEHFSLVLIYFIFYSFLSSILLSYFVNYRQSLLGADQRNYIVNAYTQATSLVCYLAQILVIYFTSNPYIWTLLFLVSNIIGSFIINWKIRQQYPWLNAKIKIGKEKYKEYPEIIKKTKQLFVHKIATFAQFQLQPILMFKFASLNAVGRYENYYIVTSKTTSFVTNVLNGGVASVGNLIAEGNKQNVIKVYWELFALRFFIAGMLAFGFWHLTEPFITCWLGEEYIMGKLLLFLIIINTFIIQIRNTTDSFITGYGLFRDVWAPITEVVISVVVAIVGGSLWGLEGVLLGTIVSMALIVGIWKPYFLFTQGIKISIWIYWGNFARFFACFALAFFVAHKIVDYITLDPTSSFLTWAIYAVIVMIVFAVVYFQMLYFFTRGTKDIFNRFATMISARLKR